MCAVSRVGLLLLAAGGSRRLGSAKQLAADSTGRTLVRRAAETALGSACRPVVVVLGALPEEVKAELTGLPLTLAVNPEWRTGLASSLRAGLTALTQETPLDAVIVMLCDQPAVTSALLDSLIESHRSTGHQIVACEYGGALGAPALFGQPLFGALLALTGDEGARRIIQAYDGPVTRLPFPAGLFDIDTPEDAQRLCASSDPNTTLPGQHIQHNHEHNHHQS